MVSHNIHKIMYKTSLFAALQISKLLFVESSKMDERIHFSNKFEIINFPAPLVKF